MRFTDEVSLLISRVPEIISDQRNRSMLSFMYKEQTVDFAMLKAAGWADAMETLKAYGIVYSRGGKWFLTKSGRTVAYGIREYQIGLENGYIDSYLEKLGVSRESIILDAGCGAGQFLICSEKFRPKLAIGLEIDPILLAIAEYLAKERRCNSCFIKGDISNLPFRAACFDGIICRNVLPYVINETAIAELCRVLKVGGKIYIVGHAFGYYVSLLKSRLFTKGLIHHIYYLFVLLNGTLLQLFGRQLGLRPPHGPRWLPQNFVCETFQTLARMESSLKKGTLNVVEHATQTTSVLPRTITVIAKKG